MIKYMIDYTLKMMPRKVGMVRTLNWIDKYNFPSSNYELIKLINIWHGIVYNAIIDIENNERNQIEEERLIGEKIKEIKHKIYNKFLLIIGPTKLTKYLDDYKFPNNYLGLENTYNNIYKELSSIKVNKRDLYIDLSNYYKDISIFKYYKYKLLNIFYLVYDNKK